LFNKYNTLITSLYFAKTVVAPKKEKKVKCEKGEKKAKKVKKDENIITKNSIVIRNIIQSVTPVTVSMLVTEKKARAK